MERVGHGFTMEIEGWHENKTIEEKCVIFEQQKTSDLSSSSVDQHSNQNDPKIVCTF